MAPGTKLARIAAATIEPSRKNNGKQSVMEFRANFFTAALSPSAEILRHPNLRARLAYEKKSFGHPDMGIFQ
jgi:hypothetical protein